MPRAVSPIRVELTDSERSELQRIARAQTMAHCSVVRAKMILRLADGASLSQTARELNQERRIVRKWAKRFVEMRILGLEDSGLRGRKARFPPDGGAALGEVGVRTS